MSRSVQCDCTEIHLLAWRCRLQHSCPGQRCCAIDRVLKSMPGRRVNSVIAIFAMRREVGDEFAAKLLNFCLGETVAILPTSFARTVRFVEVAAFNYLQKVL